MRIMTFNIRFENQEDVENRWEDRQALICETISRHEPSICGTQEAKWHQLLYLQENLPHYAFSAPHRVVDDTCQYPTLFYRKEQFTVAAGADRWLSKTPTVHRSKDWDSAFPRMMSHGVFTERTSGREFLALVTHLDHLSGEARRQQAHLIASFIDTQNAPIIVMGDFNDSPDSAVHEILTGSASALRDTWQLLERSEGKDSMTHHGFTGTPQKTRMDWILVSNHFCGTAANIIRDHRDGRYPSDHFPYCVDLEWA